MPHPVPTRRSSGLRTYAWVGAAAANVAAHGIINLFIGGRGRGFEQADCGHDLPCLAITALCNIVLNPGQIGSASCRERVCQYVYVSGVAVSFKKNKHLSTIHNII